MSSLIFQRRVPVTARHILSTKLRWPKATTRGLTTQELDDQKGDRKRVLVLGCGWGGYNLLRSLSLKHYQPVVISPRPYFVFTPLLASTSVGTLEFRTASESVRAHQGVEYFEGSVDTVDFENKTVKILSPLHNWDERKAFEVEYDKLVIAVGAHAQTFGIQGVREHAMFLKDVKDARAIRQRILRCFEEASLPTTSDARRDQLLHFCVVGGGPTGVEFSAELHDLIHDDLSRHYPTLLTKVKITVYDVAPRILGMFDQELAKYATDLFARQGIEVRTRRSVSHVEDGVLHIKEEGPVPFGLLVWSTGLAMTPLIQKLSGVAKHSRSGAIITDGLLRPIRSSESETPTTLPDVYALGDCATIQDADLPATAQVANQKAVWLRKHLNWSAKNPAAAADPDQSARRFTFRNLGVLAYLGNYRAIMQKDQDIELKGRWAWVFWRGAYLTMSVSWRNKLLIPVYWTVNWFMGRDITHF